MSHYVVTGGAGFIGSAIVRSLLRENAGRVVVLDNLLTAHGRNPYLGERKLLVAMGAMKSYDEV